MKIYSIDSEQPSIWKASYEGSNQELSDMLEAGADPNEPARLLSASGGADTIVRPLERAACSNHHGAVRLLINAGALVDLADDEDLTPLMVAAWFGCNQAVKALLQGGANPNLRNGKGVTALHYASSEGLITEAMNLLEQGAQASLAFKDELGCLPIDLAIREGSLILVEAMAHKMEEVLLREVDMRWSKWMNDQDRENMRSMGLERLARGSGQRLGVIRLKAALRPLDEAREIDESLQGTLTAGARQPWL